MRSCTYPTNRAFLRPQAPSMEALLSTNLYEENDVLSAILEQEGWL